MRLINGPVTPSAISDLIAKEEKNNETGAHSVFLGQVRRDLNQGKYVKAIEYSAYEEMVIMEANKIHKSVLSEYGDLKSLEIIHSKGIVRAGEISLFVMASSVHREEAIKACARTVELIKEKLPIWKKEVFEDESEKWKDND
jgi:molybdopterin synthase catalytic subunit